jgi:hypothetical protein
MGERRELSRHWGAAGADRSIAEGQATDAGATRKKRAQDQIFAGLRELNRHRARLIRNHRRLYGCGSRVTDELASMRSRSSRSLHSGSRTGSILTFCERSAAMTFLTSRFG